VKVADAWALLGIAPTQDARAVKRAYGRLLKDIDVDADPAAFIRLHGARDLALRWGVETPEWEPQDGIDGADALWPEEEWRTLLDAGGLPAGTGGRGFDLDFAGGLEPAGREPVAGGDARLNAASAALARLLFDPAPPAPDAVEATGIATLAACAEASVDDAATTEEWLLSALAASIPRSDPLIVPAARYFGWEDAVRTRGRRFSIDLHDLLDRRAARDVVARCRAHRDSDHHRALLELAGPPRARLGLFGLGLAKEVRNFLDTVVAPQPMVEHDLDPDNLAWWRGYFERPHLPDHFWWFMLLGPLLLALLLTKTGLIGEAPAQLGFGYAGALAFSFAAILYAAAVTAFAAARERARFWEDYRARHAAPWIVVALLLPPAASLLPGGLPIALGCGAAAVAIGTGGLFATRTPFSEGGAETFVPLGPHGFPRLAAAACVTVALAVPLGVAERICWPMLALCYLGYRGRDLAAMALPALERPTARAIVAGIAALVIAAGGAMFAWAPDLPPPALLVALPSLIVAQHLATAAASPDMRRAGWALRVLAIGFHIFVGERLFRDWLTSIGATLLLFALAYGLVRLALAFASAGRVRAPAAP
jgi:hypothetical protein